MGFADFTDRTVIVTGSSQGIGATIATSFSKAGAKVVVHYRSRKEPAEQIVEQIVAEGGQAIALGASLDEMEQAKQLITRTKDNFGSIDVLINNAGSFPNSSLLELSQEQWRQMYADNLDSTFYCTQVAAHHMKLNNGGAIINIASISGINPGVDHSHYNSAKAAVLMFTQSAAQELGQYNIRVNAIAPGLVDRPGLSEQWPDGVSRYTQATPLKRLVQPIDVANACLFLASNEAQGITGVTLPVDCGVLSSMIY